MMEWRMEGRRMCGNMDTHLPFVGNGKLALALALTSHLVLLMRHMYNKQMFLCTYEDK
jgi:hypothetical protein